MTNKPNVNISIQGEAIPTISGRRDLIVGSLPSSNPNAGNLVEKVNLKTEDEIDAIFGANSDVRNRIIKYFDTNNRNSELDVQVLEENTYSDPAVGSIAFAGTATADGSYKIALIDKKQFFKTIDVKKDETALDVATKVANAFKEVNFPRIPIISELDGSSAKFTARDKGKVGNYYGIELFGAVAGLTVTLNKFQNGTEVPNYTADMFPPKRYFGIAIPQYYRDLISVFAGVLKTRFNTENDIKDGVGFIGFEDRLSTCLSFANGLNDFIIPMGNNVVPSPYPIMNTKQTGASILTPADWYVCEFIGIRSIRLEADAPISEFVSANNKDSFGGIALASLPYHNTPLNVSVTPANLLFNNTEKKQLEDAGFSVVEPNLSESGMLTGSLVSTYKKNSLGLPDKTFKYLNYIDTGSVCREYMYFNMKSDLAQSRLTEGEIIPDRNMQNAESIRGLVMNYYASLAKEALVQKGGAIASKVSSDMVISLDLANRTVEIIAKTFPIVTQIGTVNFAFTMKFSTL